MNDLIKTLGPLIHDQLTGFVWLGYSADIGVQLVSNLGDLSLLELQSIDFALEMEQQYADAYTAFSETDYEPTYRETITPDLTGLAKFFDAERTLCTVALIRPGGTTGSRNYAGMDLQRVSEIGLLLSRCRATIRGLLNSSVRH
jgi:hypothetical protein